MTESPSARGFRDKAIGGLYARVLDDLGTAICGHEIPTGAIMTIEEAEQRFNASRSVIREALRVLEAMSLVVSRKRVGIRILAPSEWNLFDPQVIRWRLASSSRVAQLRSLTQLRTAVEPEAARLAATHAPLANASRLVGLSGELWAAGEAAETERFLELDTEFHALLLASSGNEMFARLAPLVGEVLAGRTHYGLMPSNPHVQALQWHIDVAAAIQRGDEEAAGAAMLRIMNRTLEEMSSIWASPHSSSAFIATRAPIAPTPTV